MSSNTLQNAGLALCKVFETAIISFRENPTKMEHHLFLITENILRVNAVWISIMSYNIYKTLTSNLSLYLPLHNDHRSLYPIAQDVNFKLHGI